MTTKGKIKASGPIATDSEANRLKLRQFLRLWNCLQDEDSELRLGGDVTREKLLGTIINDVQHKIIVGIAKEVAPLTDAKGEEIIDKVPILENWLNLPNSFPASWRFIKKRALMLKKTADKAKEDSVKAMLQQVDGDAVRQDDTFGAKIQALPPPPTDEPSQRTLRQPRMTVMPKRPREAPTPALSTEPSPFVGTTSSPPATDKMHETDAGVTATPATCSLFPWTTHKRTNSGPVSFGLGVATSSSTKGPDVLTTDPLSFHFDRPITDFLEIEPSDRPKDGATPTTSLKKPDRRARSSARHDRMLRTISESDSDSRPSFWTPIGSEPSDTPPGCSAGDANADGPSAASPIAATPAPNAFKASKTAQEKRKEAGEWYMWWVQRHRERYGSGSKVSGYKPREVWR